MWSRLNQWLDSLPDRTIDRMSRTVLVLSFLMLAFALSVLIVATAQ